MSDQEKSNNLILILLDKNNFKIKYHVKTKYKNI